VDTGTVIAQAIVNVAPGDSAQSLAERVQTAEHELYPWVVTQIATGKILLSDSAVRYTPEATADAHEKSFRIPA
jgi:phosphoribosylglycinamide formyltransferase-1